MAIYQFLIAVRSGGPNHASAMLTNAEGETTSHIQVICVFKSYWKKKHININSSTNGSNILFLIFFLLLIRDYLIELYDS
jgi:hypothetical protein